MHCSTCHASAPEGSRFCPSCGRPLVDPDSATRLAEAPVSIANDVTRLPADVLDVTRLPGEMPDDDRTPLDAGLVLGERFRIQRLLGRSGMGAVYLADDLRLNQPVALQLLLPSVSSFVFFVIFVAR